MIACMSFGLVEHCQLTWYMWPHSSFSLLAVEEAGRAWYIISCKHDVINNGKKNVNYSTD